MKYLNRKPEDFLLVKTPSAWVDCALKNMVILLLDHADCEKKAASTAISLMFRYPQDLALNHKLSCLAREELRHFEQVMKILEERKIPLRTLSPSRYAAGLRREIRETEPLRRLDLLLISAIIEARSCERFAEIVPFLDTSIASFYRRLHEAEERHYVDYLALASEGQSETEFSSRLQHLLTAEATLITTPDPLFRFHSGIPAIVQGEKNDYARCIDQLSG